MMMNSTEHEKNIDQLIQRLECLADRLEIGVKDKSSEQKYRDALEDVVKTLEETKNTFKSKKLKALRERVEIILYNDK